MADQKEELKSLFVFARGAGHVWDNHELGLAKEERTLQVLFQHVFVYRKTLETRIIIVATTAIVEQRGYFFL